MKKINALIVDDEERARDIIENLLLRFCPDVEILAKVGSVPKAVELIQVKKPDVVFIDIEMPEYAGYEIIDFFEEVDFEIIFVTAYDHYAVKAFELSAVDYLLKPIDIERLKSSLEKVRDKQLIKNNLHHYSILKKSLKTNEIENIVISEKGFQHVIEIKKVVALEAQESYTYIYTEERKFTASKNLKHFETMLEEFPTFFRTHKSWIVNMKFFDNYSKSLLEINLKNGMVAKLSKYKKPEFEQLF